MSLLTSSSQKGGHTGATDTGDGGAETSVVELGAITREVKLSQQVPNVVSQVLICKGKAG